VTRVLLIASSAVVRAGLDSILRSRPGMEVVGSIARLAPATIGDEIERLDPDAVLVELETNDESPALPVLGPTGERPAFVVLGDDSAGDAVADALRLGAHAVLPRDAQPDEIVRAVEAAVAGLVVLHPDRAAALLSLLPAARRAAPGTESLTAREIEVLGMLAEGAGNKQIARRLGISEHTVKFHVGSILGKLGAASRTEAVTTGLRQGLIMV